MRTQPQIACLVQTAEPPCSHAQRAAACKQQLLHVCCRSGDDSCRGHCSIDPFTSQLPHGMSLPPPLPANGIVIVMTCTAHFLHHAAACRTLRWDRVCQHHLHRPRHACSHSGQLGTVQLLQQIPRWGFSGSTVTEALFAASDELPLSQHPSQLC